MVVVKVMALDSETNFLGALPLQLDIRMDVDEGKPTVVKSPESKASLIYQGIARKTAAMLSLQSENGGSLSKYYN